MLSIHQVLTSLNGISGSISFDSQEGSLFRGWLQELLNLREQMKALKKRFPSLIDKTDYREGSDGFLYAQPDDERARLIQEMDVELQDRDAHIRTLQASLDGQTAERARLISDKSMLQHVLEDREAQIKTLLDQMGTAKASHETLSRQYAGLNVAAHRQADQIAELQAELEQARAIAADRAEDAKRLAGMLETANTLRELPTTTTELSWLTPLHQVFQEQAKSRGVELIDNQVIMLAWLLENTPNERQRTAYVCDECGTPMVSRDSGQLANRCGCPNGVSRTTVGVF